MIKSIDKRFMIVMNDVLFPYKNKMYFPKVYANCKKSLLQYRRETILTVASKVLSEKILYHDASSSEVAVNVYEQLTMTATRGSNFTKRLSPCLPCLFSAI